MRILLTLTAAILTLALANAAWADCACGKQHDTCQPDCGCERGPKCGGDVELLPTFPDYSGDLLPGAECCPRAQYTLCCERGEYTLLCTPCEKPREVCKEDCGCNKCKVRCAPKGCGCDKCAVKKKRDRNPVTD